VLFLLDDAVYLASEEERQEYVLTEKGRVYTGNARNGDRNVYGRPWNFGQVNSVENLLK
jgi:integrin beta 1